MRKIITILLLAFCSLSFSLPVKAEFLVIPPWTLKTVDGETFACYDFEAAKQLKLVDVDCYESKNKLRLLEEQLKLTLIDVDKLNSEVNKLTEVIDTQKSLIKGLSDERDDYILKYHRARARDIIGGGFPWLVATAAVFLAGGITLGYYFARR